MVLTWEQIHLEKYQEASNIYRDFSPKGHFFHHCDFPGCKYCRLGGFNSRNVFSHSSGGQKYKIKILANSVTEKAASWPPSGSVLTWPFLGQPWGERAPRTLHVSFHKSPPLWLLWTLVISLDTSFLNTAIHINSGWTYSSHNRLLQSFSH